MEYVSSCVYNESYCYVPFVVHSDQYTEIVFNVVGHYVTYTLLESVKYPPSPGIMNYSLIYNQSQNYTSRNVSWSVNVRSSSPPASPGGSIGIILPPSPPIGESEPLDLPEPILTDFLYVEGVTFTEDPVGWVLGFFAKAQFLFIAVSLGLLVIVNLINAKRYNGFKRM